MSDTDEDEIEVYRCDSCSWEGEADELVDDNDNGKFDQCKRCKGTDFHITFEESGYL